MITSNAFATAGTGAPDIGVFILALLFIAYALVYIAPIAIAIWAVIAIISFFKNDTSRKNKTSPNKSEAIAECPNCSSPVAWGDRKCDECKYIYTNSDIDGFKTKFWGN